MTDLQRSRLPSTRSLDSIVSPYQADMAIHAENQHSTTAIPTIFIEDTSNPLVSANLDEAFVQYLYTQKPYASSRSDLSTANTGAIAAKPDTRVHKTRVDGDYTTIQTCQTTRSRLTFWSFFSRNSQLSNDTGFQSQKGATWDQALPLTNNCGFGHSGAPPREQSSRVREGRERGGLLRRQKGVGRTGKPSIAVPLGMLRALGVSTRDVHLAETLERFKEMKRWAEELDQEVVKRENKQKYGPSHLEQLMNMGRNLLALRQDMRECELELYGDHSKSEKALAEYRRGPEMEHRSTIAALRADLLRFDETWAEKDHSPQQEGRLHPFWKPARYYEEDDCDCDECRTYWENVQSQFQEAKSRPGAKKRMEELFKAWRFGSS